MIDWEKFNEYLGSFKNPFILEVIEMFIDNYPQTISTLKKNVAEKNFSQLDINAHTLKTNCATFGDAKSGDLALKLELMGKNKVDDDMNGVFEQLVSAGDELISELKKYKKIHSS